MIQWYTKVYWIADRAFYLSSSSLRIDRNINPQPILSVRDKRAVSNRILLSKIISLKVTGLCYLKNALSKG